jgi:hypothetical protein
MFNTYNADVRNKLWKENKKIKDDFFFKCEKFINGKNSSLQYIKEEYAKAYDQLDKLHQTYHLYGREPHIEIDRHLTMITERFNEANDHHELTS